MEVPTLACTVHPDIQKENSVSKHIYHIDGFWEAERNGIETRDGFRDLAMQCYTVV